MNQPINTIVLSLMKEAKEVNDQGNEMYRMHLSTERYIIDFDPAFKELGWEQYDTDQDAHYFGVWVNKQKRLTLTYAEGDWSLVICDNDHQYNLEIESMFRFYDPGYIAKVIDMEKKTNTTLVQDRYDFFIGEHTGSDGFQFWRNE